VPHNQPYQTLKSNPNTNTDPITKQNTIVRIQLNIATGFTYPEKFILFIPTSVVNVTLPINEPAYRLQGDVCSECTHWF